MNTEFKPPLALHFIWHPSDQESAQPILDAVQSYLARDVDRPFSRGLNIPLFFYSSASPNAVPEGSPISIAKRDVVFILTSKNTSGRKAWQTYFDQLPLSNSLCALPIALDELGLQHGSNGRLTNLNFIRAYSFEGEHRKQALLVRIAHEVYRYGFVEIDPTRPGKDSSIKLFLSHAKSGNTGRLHAEAIYRYIDTTNMSRFFDATEISPGFKFNEEIIKHIQDSTLVTIGSDDYSSRYWCQREILCAKEHQRPILAVDCLEEYEDRIFPASSNIPCVHITANTPLNEKDILRILNAALLETIRHQHTQKALAEYQKQKWISKDCITLPRPPEIRQIAKAKQEGKTQVCYPDPALYMEEADWLSYFEVEAFTPLWSPEKRDILENIHIGISISAAPNDSFSSHHLPSDHLKRFSQDLARHLLARAGTLIYGGDLRDDGFTQFILDEAVALKSRLDSDSIHIINHIAWPIHIEDEKLIEWRAKYYNIINMQEHDAPNDILNSIDPNIYLKPSTTDNRYIWSRCLTEMREKSIAESDARVCAGGKLSGYLGMMPGILEEVLISLDQNKPIYLLGGFGGLVTEVCQSILQNKITEPLTETWQTHNNEGYQALQEKARRTGHHADYEVIKPKLENIDLNQLASNAGLDEEEYKRLFESPFIDECIHIILKGLESLNS
ncbi:hypothetical protein ACPUEK_12440 [Marinomonas gallaica]|uniref:hypothetical protein n=1 Tax=Marinomonas gallaica TaxID=1806667 RepID=UPI003CE4B269